MRLKLPQKLLRTFGLLFSLGNFVTVPLLASDFPGYVGKMSFRLTDDAKLRQFEETYRRLESDLRVTEGDFNRMSRDRNDLNARTNELNQDISSLEQNTKSQQAMILKLQALNEELQKKPEENKAAIDSNLRQIEQLKLSNNENKLRVADKKQKLNEVALRLERQNQELKRVENQLRAKEVSLKLFGDDYNNYKRKLIADVMSFNRQGAEKGIREGFVDGVNFARSEGQKYGNIDGENDGRDEGTQNGKRRDYDIGYRLGFDDGVVNGTNKGTVDGQKIGSEEGHTLRGQADGREAGFQMAQASNALELGKKQGVEAGRKRADTDGKIRGDNLGEDNVFREKEKLNLAPLSIKGAFAGTFGKMTPRFPDNFRGESYKLARETEGDILNKAFNDAYIEKYSFNSRAGFSENIVKEYDLNYNRKFNEHYQKTYNLSYPESKNNGVSNGYSDGYNKVYSNVKERSRLIKKEQTYNEPDLKNKFYVQNFETFRKSTYEAEFEKLRSSSFSQYERKTYEDEIAAAVNLYTQKREVQVQKIFSTKPVLQLVGFTTEDFGIGNIAKQDGVYQPGENILYHIKIRNYGEVEASNVQMTIKGDRIITLPKIPAKSEVSINAAYLSKINDNANLNQKYDQFLTLSTLQAITDRAEVRYFDQPENRVLALNKKLSVTLSYPMELSAKINSSVVVANLESPLSLVLKNASMRDYSDRISFELKSDTVDNIVTKKFNDVEKMAKGQNSENLSALINISNENDTYRNVAITVVAKIGDVVVGVSNPIAFMAKSAFIDRPQTTAIIVDSDKELPSLLYSIQSLGGREKVSILDLSLKELSREVLSQAFKDKLWLVLTSRDQVELSLLNNFFKNIENNHFVIVSTSGDSLEKVKALEVGREALQLNLDQTPVLFTSPYLGINPKASSSFVAATYANLGDVYNKTGWLSLSSEEYLKVLGKLVQNKSDWGDKELNAIKSITLKSLFEMLMLDRAYEKSGNIFTRKSGWVDRMGSDQNLFFNRLRESVGRPITDATVGQFITGLVAADFVNKAIIDSRDISRGKLPKTKWKIEELTKDLMEKSSALKNYDRKFYNEFSQRLSSFWPFALDF